MLYRSAIGAATEALAMRDYTATSEFECFSACRCRADDGIEPVTGDGHAGRYPRTTPPRHDQPLNGE